MKVRLYFVFFERFPSFAILMPTFGTGIEGQPSIFLVAFLTFLEVRQARDSRGRVHQYPRAIDVLQRLREGLRAWEFRQGLGARPIDSWALLMTLLSKWVLIRGIACGRVKVMDEKPPSYQDILELTRKSLGQAMCGWCFAVSMSSECPPADHT